jgi:hypothetical protein
MDKKNNGGKKKPRRRKSSVGKEGKKLRKQQEKTEKEKAELQRQAQRMSQDISTRMGTLGKYLKENARELRMAKQAEEAKTQSRNSLKETAKVGSALQREKQRTKKLTKRKKPKSLAQKLEPKKRKSLPVRTSKYWKNMSHEQQVEEFMKLTDDQLKKEAEAKKHLKNVSKYNTIAKDETAKAKNALVQMHKSKTRETRNKFSAMAAEFKANAVKALDHFAHHSNLFEKADAELEFLQGRAKKLYEYMKKSAKKEKEDLDKIESGSRERGRTI